MVAFFCITITSFSFFHYFAPKLGGKYFGLIFGTQLSHPKITTLNPLNPFLYNDQTVEFLLSVMVVTIVFLRCVSCVPKMCQLCSEDVLVVFLICRFCEFLCRNACLQKMKIFSRIKIFKLHNVKAQGIRYQIFIIH